VKIKNMFRLITCGSGAVKNYFFIKQDPAYRPVASNRYLDRTNAELPVTTCRSAGWGYAVCRVKTLSAVSQQKPPCERSCLTQKHPLTAPHSTVRLMEHYFGNHLHNFGGTS
jgi:hypothetical protein